MSPCKAHNSCSCSYLLRIIKLHDNTGHRTSFYLFESAEKLTGTRLTLVPRRRRAPTRERAALLLPLLRSAVAGRLKATAVVAAAEGGEVTADRDTWAVV